jgi:RHS repeat-associated protein
VSNIALPGGAITTAYARNALGQVTQTTDPGNNSWHRAYDSSGRQISSTDPLSNLRTTIYDNRNRPSVVTYPGGLGTLTLGYDAGGRLTSRTYSDGTEINLVYTANGRLASANNGTDDTLVNTFDANDRNINNNGITATYDAGGRLTTMTIVPGKTVTYAYDANDRLLSVTDWAGGVTDFSYDIAGRLTGMTRPNGVDRSNTWDDDSRLIGISEGTSSSVGLKSDDDSLGTSLATLSSIALTRDGKGQITAAARSVPQAASVDGLADSTNTYDGASQLTGAAYDAMGRLTDSGTDTYDWDLASRLTGYTRDGTAVTATYDAAGFRLSRSSGGQTRNYVWNYILDLPAVSIEKQGETDLNYYIHTPNGALLYRVDATTDARQFYHFDEMGNTIFLSNDAGSTIGTYAYTPYGELTASTGGLDNPFVWQAQPGVMDEGDGLYYVRARYYDSKSGRFISRDPIKRTGPRSINPYLYACANPLRSVDPEGTIERSYEDTYDKQHREQAELELETRNQIYATDTLYDERPNAGFSRPIRPLSIWAERAWQISNALRDGEISRALGHGLAATIVWADPNQAGIIESAESFREANLLHATLGAKGLGGGAIDAVGNPLLGPIQIFPENALTAEEELKQVRFELADDYTDAKEELRYEIRRLQRKVQAERRRNQVDTVVDHLQGIVVLC